MKFAPDSCPPTTPAADALRWPSARTARRWPGLIRMTSWAFRRIGAPLQKRVKNYTIKASEINDDDGFIVYFPLSVYFVSRERHCKNDEGETMKDMKSIQLKKPYSKPVLKVVKVRPREVLGSSCSNSSNTGVSPCDYAVCSIG